MFVILIYRLTVAACIHRSAQLLVLLRRTGTGPPSRFLSWISRCDLDFCRAAICQQMSHKMKSRTTWVFEPVGPIFATTHHQLYLLFFFAWYIVLFTAARTSGGTQPAGHVILKLSDMLRHYEAVLLTCSLPEIASLFTRFWISVNIFPSCKQTKKS